MHPPDPRALFDEHAAAVWELARRVTTSDAAAAAVFVGTFRSVRLRPGDVRWIRGSTLPWLLAVAARLSRPDRLAAPVAAAADGAAFHPGTITRLDQAEPAGSVVDGSVVAALNKLAPPARDVAVLCLLAGLSPADAALALAASERTVRRLIPRATAALGADGAATVPTDVVGRGTAVGLDLHAADDIAADSIPADLAVRVWAEHDDAPMQPAPAFPKRRVLICIGLVLAMLGALVWAGCTRSWDLASAHTGPRNRGRRRGSCGSVCRPAVGGCGRGGAGGNHGDRQPHRRSASCSVRECRRAL